MSEMKLFAPREGKTGLRNSECLVFGNGVEVERQVYAKTTSEHVKQSQDGREIHVLPQRMGSHVQGTDIVKIHFVPKTALAERANDPELVLSTEKDQIRIDALEGLISLAVALKKGLVTIIGHKEDDDYYLYADTNISFATFLRNRAGFRGTIGGSEAWIKVSEFISDENLDKLMSQWASLEQEASNHDFKKTFD